MNGRVYDPTLGRFLSADPNVDGVSDAQGFNRYSYVGNNPMNATDPSGFFKLKDLVKIVAVVFVAWVTGGWGAKVLGPLFEGALFGAKVAAGIGGGLAAGFSSGFAGSLLNGGSIGDAFKAGVVGGIAGAITGGILGKIGATWGEAKFGSSGWAKKALAHGFTHGARSEATGGEFRHGFLSGVFAGALESEIAGAFKGSEMMQYVAASVVGGTGSVIGGGKFANGAVSGAFSYMFNELSNEFRKLRANVRMAAERTTGQIGRVVLMEGKALEEQGISFWRFDSVQLQQDTGTVTVIDYFDTLDELMERAAYYRERSSKDAVLVVDLHGQGKSFLTEASSTIGGVAFSDDTVIIPGLQKAGWGSANGNRFTLGHCEGPGGIFGRMSQDAANWSRTMLGAKQKWFDYGKDSNGELR